MTITREQLERGLAEAYAIERELGGGGMSSVFVARELALGRRVVLKVVSPELAGSVSIERFQREIKLLARLQHPHIVPVLAAGAVDGMPFFTMPFVHGESLRIRLARDGTIPQNDVLSIAHDVACALAYAHGEGVIHRDIKPDNVLMSGDKAMVTDFGIATAVFDAAEEQLPTLTAQGVVVGTPAYMAPEQVLSGTADARSDIYSLGCMLYELLSGRTPFETKTPLALAAAHAYETPPSLSQVAPHVTPALQELVMSCLAKDPASRPQSAAEVAHRVRRVGVVKSPARAWLLRSRKRRLAVASGVPAIAAALLLFAVLQPHRRYGTDVLGLPQQSVGAPFPSGQVAAEAPAPGRLDSLMRDSVVQHGAARRQADSIRLAIAGRQRLAKAAAAASAASPPARVPSSPPATPVSASAMIRIASHTPNAALYINGEIEGIVSTPRAIAVPADVPVRLSLRALNCEPWDTTVTVAARATATIGVRSLRCP